MLRRNPLFQKSALATGVVVVTAILVGVMTGDNDPVEPAQQNAHSAANAESKLGAQTVSAWREFVAVNEAQDEEEDESDEEIERSEPPPPPPPPDLKQLVDETPEQWGEIVRGVRTGLDTEEKKIALTLDACGGSYDRELLEYLDRHRVPATLFVSGFWLNNHGETLAKLADNPLFEIANHGLRHRPCSVTGKSALEIEGTTSVGEAHREIEENARRIEAITGERTRFYRSGTAHYDEVCTTIAAETGHQVVGFDIVGDYGASFNAAQVRDALFEVEPGSIIVLHMNRPDGGTAEGVRKALPTLREMGYEFVPLAEFPLR